MHSQRGTNRHSTDDHSKDTKIYFKQLNEVQIFPAVLSARTMNPPQTHPQSNFQSTASMTLPIINHQAPSLFTHHQLFSRVNHNFVHTPPLPEDSRAFLNYCLPPFLNVSDTLGVPVLANMPTQASRHPYLQLNTCQDRTIMRQSTLRPNLSPEAHLPHRSNLSPEAHLPQISNVEREVLLQLNKIISLNSTLTSTKDENLVSCNTPSTMENFGNQKQLIVTNESTSTSSVNPPAKCSLNKKRNRPKDMPLHPLTAYNFFFSEERKKILTTLSRGESVDEMKDDDSNYRLSTEEIQAKFMLHLKKQRDQKKKKRLHRKTHGKISFKSLAKLIGKRWRNLSSVKQAYYHKLAEIGMDHYQTEMAKYKKKKSEESTQDFD